MKPSHLLATILVSICYQAHAQLAPIMQKDKPNEAVVDKFVTPADNGSQKGYYPLPATGNNDFIGYGRGKPSMPFNNFSDTYSNKQQ